MKIVLGADHGGFEIKQALARLLKGRGIEVDDLGAHSRDPVDYPDYARQVARRVSRGEADQGMLVCTTGIGMAMAANKLAAVRAAVCLTPDMARAAREHNDANVLVFGGILSSPRQAEEIALEWLNYPPRTTERAERHQRRVNKITRHARQDNEVETVFAEDPEVGRAIEQDIERQETTINLIASENFASAAVRAAQGSVMTNKYAEGYPGKRYYNGCDYVDVVERLAIERARRVFGAEHANMQPHCGSSANMAVYFAMLQPGDTILAMSLAHGGHLTHGHKVNFSGRFFNVVPYGVRPDTERLDYDEIERLAREHNPKLIVVGASAYPRTLDFARFRAIADAVGAKVVVDMAHIAGLVAGGAHPNPVPFAEFVTSTTHKTLRGPRSGMILCRAAFAAEIDKQVFPGLQGGPLMHVVAAKAVCFHEALRPEFRDYAAQIVRNAQAMAGALMEAGFRLVSGGTDNHLMLVDLTPQNLTGKDAALALDKAGIIVNKNAIPFDKRSPFVTSGIRIGTPAITTRGMQEAESRQIAAWIAEALAQGGDDAALARIRAQVRELTDGFPMP